MSSKLITKISNRPNFYFFDTALKDGKKLTVKFCLFTKDLDEAVRLANSIKDKANEALAKKICLPHTSSKSLRALINTKRLNERHIKQHSIFLDASEYKQISQDVITKFYNVIALEEDTLKDDEVSSDWNSTCLNPKEANVPSLSFEAVAKRYVQTECLKLKSSDKTKGYYIKTGKLLDEFFKDHQGKDFSYSDAENFQTTLANKKLNKKTINNYTSYSKRLFDYAIKMGKLTTNPFKMLTSFKISADEKSPKDNFSLDELKIVFDTKRLDLQNYMIFALHTGLRLNEIWQLNSKSVGEEDGIKFINVKTAKQKGGVSKYRQIPLHKNIEHLADLKWLEQIKKGKESSDYFGKRLNRHIHKSIPSANVSFHRLRGNFAKAIKDYCLENSLADLTSVLLGHSTDLATDTYAKGVSLKAKKEALKGLDDYHLLII